MAKYNIALFHEFRKPPWGGSNQFTIALEKELKNWGIYILRNRIDSNTVACLLNAYLFDPKYIARSRKLYPDVRVVHRIDGPIGVYRGTDLEIDHMIHKNNLKLANATIFQSKYSMLKHLEHGMEFVNPVVIGNASDSSIFNMIGKEPYRKNRKRKLIATSWSDGEKKGFALYNWLDNNLDFGRYEFTYIGRVPERFKNVKLQNVRLLPAMPLLSLAKELKKHDAYLTASADESCSNALIEALSCGLPAIYLKSGGHPEIVRKGGVSFNNQNEVLEAIDKLFVDYKKYQRNISIQPMKKIASLYLKVLLP